MPPKRSVVRDMTESAKFLFFADRHATFKGFAFDKDKDAVCTSEAVARAGFYCTGKESAKCPFCLKELEFEAEDDPWQEHKSRRPDCPFVLLEKHDDATWTVEDFITLAIAETTKSKLEEQMRMVEECRKTSKADFLADRLSKLTMDVKPRASRRGAK